MPQQPEDPVGVTQVATIPSHVAQFTPASTGRDPGDLGGWTAVTEVKRHDKNVALSYNLQRRVVVVRFMSPSVFLGGKCASDRTGCFGDTPLASSSADAVLFAERQRLAACDHAVRLSWVLAVVDG